MCGFGVGLLLLGSLFHTGLSCYQCFIDPEDTARLCWGLVITERSTRTPDACYKMLDRIFNNEQKVIDAAKVGRGSDSVLREILRGEIMPIVAEFDQNMNNDTVHEAVLQAAADNFIAMAYGLPRASGCFPPCGFQALGAVYNCLTCQYDTCEFPLDCPPQEITVEENNRTQMWCKVPFLLPSDVQIVWRYTEAKTVLLDRFKEVTAGVDKLYSIPSARPEHSGTYQCEIFSEEHSLVRIYFHLKVVLRVAQGHADLQDVFDQALLPAGQFPLMLPQPPFALVQLPSPDLLTVCLTSLLLLLFLTLGVLVWTFYKRKIHIPTPEPESHRNRCVIRTA